MGYPNFRQVTPTTIDISNALPARSQKKSRRFFVGFLTDDRFFIKQKWHLICYCDFSYGCTVDLHETGVSLVTELSSFRWFCFRFNKEQMLCRRGCRCEQQFRLHRLLAFDPHDDCRGVFSDWFRFPAGCVCVCYDLFGLSALFKL